VDEQINWLEVKKRNNIRTQQWKGIQQDLKTHFSLTIQKEDCNVITLRLSYSRPNLGIIRRTNSVVDYLLLSRKI